MEFSKSESCCFTGHRSMTESEKQRASTEIKRIIRTLARNGVRRFITGGAVGFDTLAASAVISLRDSEILTDTAGKAVKIHLTVAVPCPEQSEKWSFRDRALYNSILRSADEVITLSDHYEKSCMFVRNRYMVDNSAYCVAYVTHSRGGSYYTMNYAKKSEICVINLAQAAGGTL
ncbi:MAG: DUF1273 domain-containing protein [Ruminococcaceae bacterium]|nr:DUF1273 domain-containing protein [Oscillospiraceae bacterium]